ncbi:hypothetical protein U0070_017710 [Myodes glareolus]|uniref:Uncharacterized protein n=1 Tax=Myodes glareolus TaxID=447135 RepID=A0AAW0K7Q1_MYOGA
MEPGQRQWSRPWWCEGRWAGPEGQRAELAPPLEAGSTGRASELGSSSRKCRGGRASELTSPATTQIPGPEPGYELAHPNIHLIYELLEHVKEMDLEIQHYRVSTTQDSRISKRSPSESSLLVGEPRPEASNLIKTRENEHLQDERTKGFLPRVPAPTSLRSVPCELWEGRNHVLPVFIVMFITAINAKAGESRVVTVAKLVQNSVWTRVASDSTVLLLQLGLQACRSSWDYRRAGAAEITGVPAQLGLQACRSSRDYSEKSSAFTQHSSAMYGSLAQVDFILLSKAHGVCHDPHLSRMPDSAVLVLLIRSCPGVESYCIAQAGFKFAILLHFSVCPGNFSLTSYVHRTLLPDTDSSHMHACIKPTLKTECAHNPGHSASRRGSGSRVHDFLRSYAPEHVCGGGPNASTLLEKTSVVLVRAQHEDTTQGHSDSTETSAMEKLGSILNTAWQTGSYSQEQSGARFTLRSQRPPAAPADLPGVFVCAVLPGTARRGGFDLSFKPRVDTSCKLWEQGEDSCFFGCLVNFFGFSLFPGKKGRHKMSAVPASVTPVSKLNNVEPTIISLRKKKPLMSAQNSNTRGSEAEAAPRGHWNHSSSLYLIVQYSSSRTRRCIITFSLIMKNNHVVPHLTALSDRRDTVRGRLTIKTIVQEMQRSAISLVTSRAVNRHYLLRLREHHREEPERMIVREDHESRNCGSDKAVVLTASQQLWLPAGLAQD